MQASFFGTDTDILQVWRWLYDTPDMKIFEGHSIPDQPNRWFASWDDIVDCYRDDRLRLAAWPENVGGVPFQETITFTPETQRQLGAKGRSLLHSPASIRVVGNNDENGCLTETAITCWDEKGVRQRSVFAKDYIDSVDWKAFSSLSRALQRRVKKASPAKLGSTPIMPDAFEKLRTRQIKLWGWGIECDDQSPQIVTNI